MSSARERAFDLWGLTDDERELHKVEAWRDAAVADGWEIRPTYGSESQDRASRLTRDGFVAQVLTRKNEGKRYHFEAKVSIWGPDGLSVTTPQPYSFEALLAGLRKCHYCQRSDVDTQRVSFAGRCCAECLEGQRKMQEQPGWDS